MEECGTVYRFSKPEKIMTKRAGRKKSPARGKKTTGSKPESQSIVPKATGREPKPDSFFWPELSQENKRLAEESGRGAQLKQLADLRLELRAVNERWPIPAELRERMIFENARMMMNPNASPKERLMASRMLLGMDQANNKPRDLPLQITGNTTITVNQVLAMLDGSSSDDLDFRDRKILPGSVDDYA
jgi:hypothetical protein